ncbi:MAG: hypothetical protein HY552_00975, partial [Elusimicrobia bacterium]|nr:hypothetical protein [Elusimicrobiota bacterium]
SGAVDTTKLKADAVAGFAILNGAVTDAKVASGIGAAKLADGSVDNSEFQYLNGVTSAIQTQLDGKQATVTGAATTITGSNLSGSMALVSDGSGKVAAHGTVSDAELGYLDGVTSAVQAQLDGKLSGAAGAVDTSKIGSGAVDTTKLKTDAVAGFAILNGAVTDAKIVDVAAAKVTAGTFASGVILPAAQVQAGALGGSVIASSIAVNSVHGAALQDGAVSNAKILDGTIVFADMGANGCGPGQLMRRNAANTAWECGITVNLGPSVADNDATAAASIFINDQGGGALLRLQQDSTDRFVVDNSGNLTTASIGAAALQSGAVQTAKLATDAVASGAILNGAVTDAKVASGIGAAKLADGSVDNSEFQYLNG